MENTDQPKGCQARIEEKFSFICDKMWINTWLQTNGGPPRMAQELMRNSDQRLTEKVYLDTSLLPLQECGG
jgi:hypothetical protein